MLCALIGAMCLWQVSSPSEPQRIVEVSGTDALQQALAEAKPGTRILVAAGDYLDLAAANICGQAGQPIVVSALDADSPPVFRRGLRFSAVAHFELDGLVIAGAPTNGLNIDDGGNFQTPSHHVELRNLKLRDCGGRDNHDGIKLSGVNDFRVIGCTIERWGRGGSAVDMVGCQRGVIEACTIRDLEIDGAANGVQAKGGSREITIRSSRFEHAGQRAINLGGSTGRQYFRPQPRGFEARGITVERCTFIGSQAPIAFVGVDGASVQFNTFYQPRKWVARILQETNAPDFVPCRNGHFRDNLIVYRASDVTVFLNIGPDTAPETFEFARNYWYCEDDPGRALPNLPVKELGACGGKDPMFLDAAGGCFELGAGSPARAYGASAIGGP